MIYNGDISIGAVIGTYRTIPYVHLGLESAKRNKTPVKILVNDDCSNEKEKLKNLCNRYECDFHSNNKHIGWLAGDLSAFYHGLKWANDNQIDILVKFSRRWVPVNDWTVSLKKMAYETQSHTFNNICRNLNWGFRSECVGMHVKTWMEALPKIEEEMKKKKGIFVEGFIHNISRTLKECEEYKKYKEKHPRDYSYSGYVPWGHIGENRIVHNPEVYWHHSKTPKEYYELSKSWLLNYSEKDFNNPLDKLGH